MDYVTELGYVEQAIADILRYGQSYSVEGRTLTRANLNDLYKRQGLLKRLITNGSSITLTQGVI